MGVCVRERTRLYFESIVPVTASHTLCQVAPEGQCSRLPLLDDVTVLVEHQPGIVEELGGAAAQVDATRARGGYGATVKAHEPRVFEDPHVRNRAFEQHFQRSADPFRQA